MQSAALTLANTPAWAYALLAYLVWRGIRSLRPRTVPVWRPLVVPALFIAMGVSRMLTSAGGDATPLVTWLLAAIVFAALAGLRGPRLVAVDRTAGTVTRPGSVVPLIRNVLVFALQYAVAVASARHLDATPLLQLAGRAVSGATAGYFAGWAALFIKWYLDASPPRT